MRLTDLFRTESQQISEANRIPQTTPARTDQINQQIRALTPGQTLQGEVVGRNGQEVQIRVDGDLVLNAKMDQNMNLEVGKNMTFEVKNNGSSLTLSPLFTNTATDANIMKALDMASLPINETTITMTEQMMSAGLSVDKGSLQQMFREMNLFPKAESADIVDLHRLAMPVNEQNVNQMISYRNLTHQLVSGMTNVLDELPQTFSTLLTEGKVDDAVTLYQTLSKLADASWEEQTTEGTSALEILQTDGAKADALTQQQQTEMIDLQTLVNRRDVAYSASSNIVRALGTSQSGNAANF